MICLVTFCNLKTLTLPPTHSERAFCGHASPSHLHTIHAEESFMKRLFALALLGSVILAACGASTDPKSVTLTLGAYSTPQDDYAKIIPLFQTYWQHQQPGQNVTFKQSYQGSGAQARAIINGFEADVAALSVASDIDKIKSA